MLRFLCRRMGAPHCAWTQAVVLLTVLLFGVLAASAQPAASGQPDSAPRVAFDISSQPLTSALHAFAETSGFQVSFPAELAAGVTSATLVGTYRPEEALQVLLSGTGLTYRFTDATTLTLMPGSSAPPVLPQPQTDTRAMPKSDVEGRESPKPKPVKVPEIVVKDVRERDGGKSYVAEDTRTATKSDIPLIETPQSITVITRKRIVDQEANTLAQALRYTAGVQAEPVGFEPRMTFLRFRGFDATTTGLFKDGLQLRNPGFAVSFNLEPYGAEQIDVLRGPASFLYGQGSPGGLLNYISKRPTDYTLREVQFLAGNFDRYEGRFDFGGRIDDSGTFSYRLTGLFRESGSQIDHVPNDRLYIAPALTWKIAPGTSLTFLGTYQKDRLGMSQGLPVAGTLRDSPFGMIDPSRFVGQPGLDKYRRQEHSAGYELAHQLASNWSFLQKFRYLSTELNDISTFGFPLGSNLPTLDRAEQATFGKLTSFTMDNQVHGQLSTGPVQHRLLAGVDIQRIEAKSTQDFALASSINVFNRHDYGTPGTVPLPGLAFSQDTTQWQTGVYVQDQAKYENWLLTVGGRHDWARTEPTNNVTGITTPQDDSKPTGRAALTYLFDIGLAPYASYSTHFLPSAGLDPSGNSFKPETGRQYEVGVKYQPRGSRSFLTAAVFDLTRENMVQFDPGLNRQVQRGKVRSQGLELEGVAAFDSGVELIASYTLVKNEVISTTDPTEEGKRLPQTPAQFGSLWAKYTVPEGRLKGLGIGGGARYTGNTYADVANTFKVPDFVVGDAMVDYVWRGYRFALNVTNIFNHDAFACFDRGGANFCTFGQRRTVVGTVAYRW